MSRYRWVVLAAGVVAQAASAAVLQGLPGLAPQLRDEFALGLTGLGVLLTSVTFGLVATLALWGAAADRFGERLVMAVGLVLAAASLGAATTTEDVLALGACLVAAGAAGASVNAASGRAVLGWFGPGQRGFAMGLRQTALPLGAGLAAALLPPLAGARGLDGAFLALAGCCLAGAVVVALLVREAPHQPARDPDGRSPVHDPRIRRMASVSMLLVVPQFAVVAFVVVYLVDEHDVAPATAALALAAVQLSGGAARIAAGWWSDRLRLRVVPLRRLAVVIASMFGAVAVLSSEPVTDRVPSAVVPLLLVAGVVAISWNGLAFTAVGEFAGPGRAGTALGLQNTAVALGAAVTAPVLGAVVDRTTWAVGYGLACAAAVGAVLLLGPLVRGERPHPPALPADGPVA